MERGNANIASVFWAISLSCAILLGTILPADAISKTAFFQNSRFVRSILSQDSTSITGLATNPSHLNVLVKFLGAVTAAYINFEMIPVNEASTFTTIFESLNDEITIDEFSYHGKKITVFGTAANQTNYERFLSDLSENGHFKTVTGHEYTTTDDIIRFEIECAP